MIEEIAEIENFKQANLNRNLPLRLVKFNLINENKFKSALI